MDSQLHQYTQKNYRSSNQTTTLPGGEKYTMFVNMILYNVNLIMEMEIRVFCCLNF